MLQPVHAVILGVVEGVTEFLPISSTGHLILASAWLGLQGEAVKTFEVVIQAGAVAAVLGLYRKRVRSIWRGLRGHDVVGLRLARNLFLSFVPAAVAGLLLHRLIKQHLFAAWPVIAALALGGVAMIAMDRRLSRSDRAPAAALEALTARQALLIGLAQCLSLWPGTSRAMVTIVAGVLIGLPAPAAAEYSFLLALPTLGAATVFEAITGGSGLLAEVGWLSGLCGFVVAAVVAGLVMRGFVQYLGRHGLAVFGWYRLALAAAVGAVWLRA